MERENLKSHGEGSLERFKVFHLKDFNEIVGDKWPRVILTVQLDRTVGIQAATRRNKREK